MRKLLLVGLLLVSGTLLAANPRVKVETSAGDFVLELYPDKAPKTVENFLRYVSEGFYDGTVFHRVIDGFMIQGGGFSLKEGKLERKPTHEPIHNEADNGLSNARGTIAMARTSQPDSATAQFFINLADNGFLDFKDKTRRGWGYAVFGKVVEGMDTVARIGKLTTTARPGGMRNVPIEPPVIRHMVLLTPPPGEEAPAEAKPAATGHQPAPMPGMPQSPQVIPGMPQSLHQAMPGMPQPPRGIPGMPQSPQAIPGMPQSLHQAMPGMPQAPQGIPSMPQGPQSLPGIPADPTAGVPTHD